MASSFFLLLTRFNEARRIDDVSRGSIYESQKLLLLLGKKYNKR
jgi:hypothetical protein